MADIRVKANGSEYSDRELKFRSWKLYSQYLEKAIEFAKERDPLATEMDLERAKWWAHYRKDCFFVKVDEEVATQ